MLGMGPQLSGDLLPGLLFLAHSGLIKLRDQRRAGAGDSEGFGIEFHRRANHERCGRESSRRGRARLEILTAVG